MPAVDRTRQRATVAAALAGFACMAAELTAVRLLAPHFGDSAYVWTNVIGVILGALAGGAVLGGRLASAPDVAGRIGSLLGVAAVWLAIVPFAAPWFGELLLPADLPLDAAMPALVRGSFVATALLFGPVMLLIGALSPMLVTWVVRSGTDVGRAAGRIGAAGTIGSLGGTFVATHVLVPHLGCRIAMAAAGALLALAALCVLTAPRRRAAAGAMAALVVASFLLHGGPLRPPPHTSELVAERESRTQFLQVLRTRAEPARTSLVINEGLDSFHSLLVDGSVFTDGAYYDWHALAPLLVGDVAAVDVRALSIGDAAGTLRAIYAGVHPGARVDAVDIDRATMDLGDEYFRVPKAEGRKFVVDGRVFLGVAREQWHVIHVDAYAHQVYVPAHLASREFFAALRERLVPGGVVACNVGALRPDDPVLDAIATTLRDVFGHARAMLIPASRNALLIARNGEPPPPIAADAEHRAGNGLSGADRQHWAAIVRTASNPRAWIDVGLSGPVLRDDQPILDHLLQASYVDRGDDGDVVPCTGTTDPAGAEGAAYAARLERDWPGVLDAVGRSSAPTTLLRELAGDARGAWRQLRTADAEYEQAFALATQAADRDRLAAKRARTAELAAPVAAAERAGARNRWLQVAVLGAAGLLWLVLRRLV